MLSKKLRVILHYMSIRQRREDKSYYVQCDFEGCLYTQDLQAKDFWEASAEAKRLGWLLAKDRDGKWCNFNTEYCKMCHLQPPIIVKKKK